MPMFVDTARLAVRGDDSEHVVYVRAKLSYKERLTVLEAMESFNMEHDSAKIRATFVMLETAIVAWEGPDFDGVPVTSDNIWRLDPEEPFWQTVIERVGSLYQPKESPNPKSNGTSG